ncbi:MAG: imidazole glycerol phosphate synthase subunit HisH [Anaerolineales bacterium]|nr:imidazole glycerol phosphate synthase subunit HisH [Anaerolineales bacterium]
MTITVVDYGVGNLGSIINMLKKVGVKAIASSDADTLMQAGKLILPGVGAFDAGMNKLNESGLVPLLNHLVLEKNIPVLGLCLGLQLMTKGSEEGQAQGLGWLDAETLRFKFGVETSHLKIPHMGWNTIEIKRQHPLFTDLDPEPRFYFVHSFYVHSHDPEAVLAETDYGGRFHSIFGKGNIVGAQFHPEKSHKFGMRFLKNFAEVVK